MANESTYALISDLLPLIWGSVLRYMQHTFIMPRLVRTFNDTSSWVDRKVSEYGDDSATVSDNLGELDDLVPTALDRSLLTTLTPKEIGKQYLITDRRVESDDVDVVRDARTYLGYSLGRKVESDLLGDFANFTGGVYGSDANSMSLALLYRARARLEANLVPGPYIAVIHPYQWLDIFNEHVLDLSQPAPLDFRNIMQRQYYVTQINDLNIVVSTMVPVIAVANERQTVNITGSPSGGTFKLAFADQATAAIAYNVDAAGLVSALEALPNIATGDITVTGSNPNFTVEFGGTLAGQDVPQMTLYDNSLTGGTSPSVSIATTVQGRNYARAGMFNRDALAFDLRRGLRVEAERNASLRATELNATMVYAHGVWRATHGVIIKSDASMPLS